MAKKDRNPRRRFFVESLETDRFELSADQAHHALNVLRLTDGAEVALFDGAGGVAEAVLRVCGRKRLEVHVLQRRQATERPEPLVELAFAIPKGKRLDWLLEKATELGAARLSPVVFERSVVIPTIGEEARSRWRKTCIVAAKQCGAEFLPEITPARMLAEFLADVEADIRIRGDVAGDLTVPAALKDWSAGKRIVILIGPEGGFTAAEADAANDARFRHTRLGNLILRIETAAVALLAVVKACCQDT